MNYVTSIVPNANTRDSNYAQERFSWECVLTPEHKNAQLQNHPTQHAYAQPPLLDIAID
jgi:hypothetical protein